MPNLIRVWGPGFTERTVEQGRLVEYESVASTMDVARARLRDGDGDLVGVRTEYQSAGRGRLGAAWLAPPGACLLVTYIVRCGPGPNTVRNLAFAAGVAVAESVEEVAEISPGLKWPNDIILSGRKVGGILIETIPDEPRSDGSRNAMPAFLVGIGLNVNTDGFPPDLAASATSLEIETGLLWDLNEIEGAVRTKLWQTAAEPWEEILRRWRARDVSVGLRYRAPGPGDGVTGVAREVTEAGLLRLDTDNGAIDVLSATSIKA